MEKDNKNQTKDKRKHRSVRLRNITLNAICIFMAIAGVWWGVTKFRQYHEHEITDDAYIDQYVVPIYVRVPGYIRSVHFREHQFVHQGDTLVTIDDSEYQIRVDNAKAELLDAEAARDVLNSEIEASRTNVSVLEASLAETKALLLQLEKEDVRYKSLLDEESV